MKNPPELVAENGTMMASNRRPSLMFKHGFLGLFLLIYGACAQTSHASSSVTPTPTGPLAIIGTNCGTMGGLRKVGNPPVQEQCLFTAYQHCQQATLLYIQAGVDAGRYHYLTVQKANPVCAIIDRVLPYGITPHQLINYTCKDLIFSPSVGLTAQQCGDEGDVTLPYSFS